MDFYIFMPENGYVLFHGLKQDVEFNRKLGSKRLNLGARNKFFWSEFLILDCTPPPKVSLSIPPSLCPSFPIQDVAAYKESSRKVVKDSLSYN